jgi:hypothetical protein
MSKKVWYSLIVILIAIIAAITGTVAFFTATQTINDANFIAGTLDLDVRSGNVPLESFILENLGEDITMSGYKEWTVKNTGTMAGRLYLELENIENINRGCNESKMLARGYEPAITSDMDLDEVQAEIQRNIDLCTAEEEGLLGNAMTFIVEVDEEEMVTVNLASGNEETFRLEWENLEPIIFDSSESLDASKVVKVSWSADPSEYGNEIQNDELKFDIKFHLTQDLGEVI